MTGDAPDAWTLATDPTPYTRAWRRWVIAHAQLPDRVKTRRGSVRAGVMRAVLVCVDDHAGQSHWARLRHATIAQETGYSTAHVRRAVAALEQLGLLAVRRRRRGTGWAASEYLVGYLALADLVPPSERAREPRRTPARNANRQATPALGPGQTDELATLAAPTERPRRSNRVATVTTPTGQADQTEWSHRPDRVVTLTTQNHSMEPVDGTPSPEPVVATVACAEHRQRSAPLAVSNQVGDGGEDNTDEWDAVVRRLRDAGVCVPESAVNSARRAGCTPQHVFSLLEHWDAAVVDSVRAWGPGALWHRVRAAKPDDDPTAGWPEPAAKYRAAQLRVAARARTDAYRTADAKARAHAQADAKRRAKRRAQYGPVLDRLSDAERRCLQAAAAERLGVR